MSRKNVPEINAGSMADIAFLLLIFFLVTTTMNIDAGIFRKIPEKPKENSNVDIKDKNLLEVTLNFNNELFVEKEKVSFNDLKQIAIDFIDNAGGTDFTSKNCDYCEGSKNPNSSDHPKKAVITIQSDRNTNYETYIKTLDILNSAYTHLRNKLSLKLYQQNYTSLLDEFEKSNNTNQDVKEKISVIRDKYPLLLSDAEIKN